MRAKGWLVLMAMAMAVACAGGPPSSEPQRPNIVFVMVDDMGWADLGSYGSKAIHTPNLDRLASEGMRFTDAYAGHTVCAPSRCALMTGKHTGKTTVRDNAGTAPIRDADVTIAEVLQQGGYATGGLASGDWVSWALPERPRNRGLTRSSAITTRFTPTRITHLFLSKTENLSCCPAMPRSMDCNRRSSRRSWLP